MKTAIEGYRLAYKQVYKLKEAMQARVEKKKKKVGKAYFICKGFPVYNEKDLLDIYQSDYLQSYEYDRYLDKLEKLQKAEIEGIKRKEDYALEALTNVCSSLINEIKEMEFDDLAPEEQTRLLEERNRKAGLEV